MYMYECMYVRGIELVSRQGKQLINKMNYDELTNQSDEWCYVCINIVNDDQMSWCSVLNDRWGEFFHWNIFWHYIFPVCDVFYSLISSSWGFSFFVYAGDMYKRASAARLWLAACSSVCSEIFICSSSPSHNESPANTLRVAPLEAFGSVRMIVAVIFTWSLIMHGGERGGVSAALARRWKTSG